MQIFHNILLPGPLSFCLLLFSCLLQTYICAASTFLLKPTSIFINAISLGCLKTPPPHLRGSSFCCLAANLEFYISVNGADMLCLQAQNIWVILDSLPLFCPSPHKEALFSFLIPLQCSFHFSRRLQWNDWADNKYLEAKLSKAGQLLLIVCITAYHLH